MTVNVKIVVMEHLWCDFLLFFNTKNIATDCSNRLPPCCDLQFRLFDSQIFGQGVVLTLT